MPPAALAAPAAHLQRSNSPRGPTPRHPTAPTAEAGLLVVPNWVLGWVMMARENDFRGFGDELNLQTSFK